jgi:hypothetical protein
MCDRAHPLRWRLEAINSMNDLHPEPMSPSLGSARSRVMRVAALLSILGALGLLLSPGALAGVPEVPEVGVQTPVHAHEAVFSGVLNPAGTPVEPGSYQFVYRASTKSQCKGAGEREAPGMPALALGGEHEEVPAEPVSGLTAGTEYAVCLVAENGSGTTPSSAMSFTTAIIPETPTDEKAEPVTATTAVLHGVLNQNAAENPGTYEFVYRESASSCRGEGETSTGTVVATGAKGEAVEAELTGLLPNVTYSFCLVARNEAEEPAKEVPASFTTLPVKATLEDEASGDITETSATVSARVDPNGAATSCTFEYGTTSAYGLAAACAPSPGAGHTPVAVSATLPKLAADTEYHWRLVTSNAAGAEDSADQTFVSYPALSSSGSCPDEEARVERNSTGLPDCRAYELVTPPQKNGALIDALTLNDLPPQISGDGQHVIAASIQCFADTEACIGNRNTEGDPYEFTRTDSGWVTKPLAPPAASYEANSWYSVNANTGTALFAVPSSPESLTDEWLARGEGGAQEEGALVRIGPLGEHAGEPPFHDTPPNYDALSQQGVVATENLSHIVFETTVPLWGFDSSKAEQTVYEYAGPARALLLVGVEGGFESHKLISQCGTSFGSASVSGIERKAYGSLSENGQIVYFTAIGKDTVNCGGTEPPVGELYARVDGEDPEKGFARSVPISVKPPASSCKEAECQENAADQLADAQFEGASANGASVFFTDAQQLTDDASQGSGSARGEGCDNESRVGGSGCNLYEWECPGCDEVTEAQEVEEPKRSLIDVSAGAKEAGGPHVQGAVSMSSDGSHVYFVAKGVLTGTEANANGEQAEAGADNLYVYSSGHRAFIAQLSAQDKLEWNPNKLRANVTPNGEFLVFTSHRALTKDDTRPEGPAQVYEYDAATRALTRISVGQDDYNDDGNAGEGEAKIVGVEGLGSEGLVKSVPVRSDVTMSNNGAFVFFESPVALTPGALNDVPLAGGDEGALDEGFAQNVYEWAADGAEVKGRVVCTQPAGCTSLISDGKDLTDTSGGGTAGELSPVELLGTDESGKSVFFTTFDPLVPEDTDTQRDIYDARICTEAEPCTAPVSPEAPAECGEERCQAPPAVAGGSGVPGSETFFGPGNPLAVSAPAAKPPTRLQLLAAALKTCRKKRSKHKRVACEAQARKRYGPPHKAKKPVKKASKRVSKEIVVGDGGRR